MFIQKPTTHLKGCGCPMCNESQGERKISQILENKKINFISQKKFDGCLYKRKLKFDFYLPDYNTCIEYDGEQHNVMYRFEKTNERLKIRQKRDKIKNEYCKENNIHLIRIKYNESIEEKLKMFNQ
jgi:very-short-patch-repair endonuclease